MTVPQKLQEIGGLFSTMSSGVADEELIANYNQMLATAFTELAELMKAAPGWAAATGTASRTTFDTASVTLPVLASKVKAIIDDQLTRGEFGP
jgi:hypothetical protein